MEVSGLTGRAVPAGEPAVGADAPRRSTWSFATFDTCPGWRSGSSLQAAARSGVPLPVDPLPFLHLPMQSPRSWLQSLSYLPGWKRTEAALASVWYVEDSW